MLVSLIILSIGIAGWVAGAFYQRHLPDYDSTKGLAALPGCIITVVGFIAVLWHFAWWLGLAILLLALWGAYRLILPDKYQIWR